MPDFRAELLGSAEVGDSWWAEWHRHGTRSDGTRLEMGGVTIFGVGEDRIRWGRLYLEEVEGGRGSTRPSSTWPAAPHRPAAPMVKSTHDRCPVNPNIAISRPTTILG